MGLLHTLLCLLVSGATFAEDTVPNSFPNLHMQVTSVGHEHASFSSPYSGTNSLDPGYENKTSLTWTLFAGFKLWRDAALYVDPELSGGSGLSRTTGVAGFPNGEIYRVDDPSPKWNLARLYLKQTFGLGGAHEEIKDGQNQIATSVDVNRLTVVAGRFALNDFFDNNRFSHDPRTQFLNWVFMDHGAWDYAADTRGYSWGLYFELNHPDWAIRFASVLVPKYANQLEMDNRPLVARGDNLEFERRYALMNQPGVTRLLLFENHANMGNYRQTIDNPQYNMQVIETRAMSVKYGAGVNIEQNLNTDLGAFLRASWNDGHSETWAFTEIDRAFSVGLILSGGRWHRPLDNAGLALAINGLSDDHRDYLASGGYGFIVGDGKLNYATEKIVEIYYLFKVLGGLDFTGDYQYVMDPAYNSDRGPVSICSFRLHYEM
jgi:high affinity Mn2+ porin